MNNNFILPFNNKNYNKAKEYPLVSVIIPVYNVEKYLAQCLDSVIFNSYKNLEIIVIDDGSPDNSNIIYNKYAKIDKRIKIIIQKNSGLSVVRNLGIDVAKGEYIHFMDSDDYIDLNFYEELVMDIVNFDADIAACGLKTSDNSVTITFKEREIFTDLITKIQKTQCLQHSHAVRYLFRRKIFIENELKFEVGRFIQDAPFIPQALKVANRVVINPYVFYHYIRRPGSVTMQKNNQKVDNDYKWACEMMSKFVESNSIPKSLLNGTVVCYKFRLFGFIPFGKIIIKNSGKNFYFYFIILPFYLLKIKVYQKLTKIKEFL